MSKRALYTGVLAACLYAFTGQATSAGDPARGERLFNGFPRCYACHSLEPGVNKVGPSLAWLFGRAAATAAGFDRYSEAMQTSGITWDADTLNAFLADPQKFVPGNAMARDDYFVSDRVSSAQNRADIIAYLEQATMSVNY